MARRPLDAYFSPEWAAEELITRIPSLDGARVLECCSGEGALVMPMILAGAQVTMNDIADYPADHHLDVTDPASWKTLGTYDWIISNIPFDQAARIVPLAYEHATEGIAFLLRLSFLEPVKNRAEWLSTHPLTQQIVLPRISFTGDGKTDSVTCAWMVWEKGRPGLPGLGVHIVPRRDGT